MTEDRGSYEGSSTKTASLQSSPKSSSVQRQQVDTVVMTSDTHSIWAKFNPPRRFYLLKTAFVLLCLFDTVHWAYMLRDDDETSPNVWKFYLRINAYDQYYLVSRMFADILVCIIGLGTCMWTRKVALSIPCLVVQSVLICVRLSVWVARRRLPQDYRVEDMVFVAFEFILPSLWMLLSISVVRTIKAVCEYDRLHEGPKPPVIVLTVKNDNEESVQIQINP
ncbi:unnamed protein product [Anisakis simplex]|uniref:Transmembrane protein n=1 Tax=Anisakis simplex TaxID=6269 RepID=A0A0M3K414_ANISI|nr:unnamed protein product [Anisakis simplex]